MKQWGRPCWRWRRRVGLLAARVLEESQSADVREHLDSCAACRHHLAAMEALEVQLRELGVALPELEPTAALRPRWQGEISRVGGGSKVGEGSVDRSGGWGSRLLEWLPGGRFSWPALAGCWLLILVFRVASPSVEDLGVTASPPALPELISVLRLEEPVPASRRERVGPDQASAADGEVGICHANRRGRFHEPVAGGAISGREGLARILLSSDVGLSSWRADRVPRSGQEEVERGGWT